MFSSVVEALEKALSHELESVHRYFGYSKLLMHSGYPKVAGTIKSFSIDEMRHADALLDRILFLNGVQRFVFPGEMVISESVQEIFSSGSDAENSAIDLYNDIIDYCRKNKDSGSATMMETLLSKEEEHLDWFRTQSEIIADVGIENYLSDCMGG